jgi:PEP-CTERM/exosortase A-associated glycosyltransferase
MKRRPDERRRVAPRRELLPPRGQRSGVSRKRGGAPMSLRILHVLDHSIPLHSGYTFRTRAILREQRRMGWETFHLTSPKHSAPSGPEEDVDGLHFYRTLWHPGPPGAMPAIRELALMRATARRLDEVARIVRPDILHAHSPVLNALPALWVGRRLGIPVVYEVRAFWEDAAADHGTAREGGLRYRLTHAIETFAFRRADAVTTICEGLRSEIVARGIPQDKVTVIPNAVDIERFTHGIEPDERLKQNLGLAGSVVLGFIGSFYAYEGLALLLEALPRILAVDPRVRILLVGGGPQEANLKHFAATHGIGDKVVFAGRVPHNDVQRYYDLVDVLVYPRLSMRLTELVTPLKPLEAMAQGRMLVASDVGGHRELIKDGRTGVLFKAGDAGALAAKVLALLTDQPRWPRMRMAARNFVESERTWAASVGRYDQVYQRLVGKVEVAHAPT